MTGINPRQCERDQEAQLPGDLPLCVDCETAFIIVIDRIPSRMQFPVGNSLQVLSPATKPHLQPHIRPTGSVSLSTWHARGEHRTCTAWLLFRRATLWRTARRSSVCGLRGGTRGESLRRGMDEHWAGLHEGAHIPVPW